MDRKLACRDCGTNVSQSGEYGYMVQDVVWEAAGCDTRPGHGSDEFLCVGCLETRLGRRLVPADFTEAAVNEGLLFLQSPRLISRIRGTSEHQSRPKENR